VVGTLVGMTTGGFGAKTKGKRMPKLLVGCIFCLKILMSVKTKMRKTNCGIH